MRWLTGDPCSQSAVNSLRELLERQSARQEVLTKGGDSLFAVSIGGAQGRVVHGCHARARTVHEATVAMARSQQPELRIAAAALGVLRSHIGMSGRHWPYDIRGLLEV